MVATCKLHSGSLERRITLARMSGERLACAAKQTTWRDLPCYPRTRKLACVLPVFRRLDTMRTQECERARELCSNLPPREAAPGF